MSNVTLNISVRTNASSKIEDLYINLLWVRSLFYGKWVLKCGIELDKDQVLYLLYFVLLLLDPFKIFSIQSFLAFWNKQYPISLFSINCVQVVEHNWPSVLLCPRTLLILQSVKCLDNKGICPSVYVGWDGQETIRH